MSPRPHIIRRQLVELHLPRGADGRAVQERISQLCRETITALLDEHLSRYAGPDPVQLARVELDLGTIALPDLERLLPLRLADELLRVLPPSALAAQTVAPRPSPDNPRAEAETTPHQDVELIAYFLRSGLLPWWATPVSFERVAEAFARARAQHADDLKRLLTELLTEPLATERFFTACPDALLEQLFGLWLPVAPQHLQRLQDALRGPAHAGTGHAVGRRAWWYGLYKTAADHDVAAGRADAPAIYQLLTRFASAQGGSLPLASPPEQSTLELLGKVFPVKNAAFAPAPAPAPAPVPAHTPAGAPPTGPAPLTSSQAAASQAAASQAAASQAAASQAAASQAAASQPGATTGPHPSAPDGPLVAAAGKESALPDAGAPPHNRPAPTLAPLVPASETAPDRQADAFNDSDKISIQNAGLVLFWPFLPRFFATLGLTDEGRLRDGEAAARACLLLQYLVEGAADTYFEAALPLNKLLCGLELAQPLATTWAIQPEEEAAAIALLEAVIQNGPLWRTLSVDAFRQAFLRREGLLSTRDGHWLLQADRQTHDVVLDRLPWAVRHVKLPWMEHLLFIEWQQA